MIPWIGREKYISSTIQALLRQDYSNLEILVSDNSLSQSAGKLLRSIASARVKIIDQNSHRLSSADHFTACIAKATGKYMMLLSDDDLIEPKYISGMYEAIRLRPESAAILGEQVVISEDDLSAPEGSDSNTCRNYDGVTFFLQRLINPRYWPIVTYVSVFARRDALLAFPYRDYPDGSNSDNYMMLCLALSGRVTISSKKMYYRVYENSSGLKTKFEALIESCRRYENDVVDLLSKNRAALGFGRGSMIRILVRARNVSMMIRRLFTLYRGRMTTAEILTSSASVILYFLRVDRRRDVAPRR